MYMENSTGVLMELCVCCQLGDVMVDISSNLMLTDERVLWMAQKEARACSRVIESLQRIAVLRLASGSYYTVNIVHDLLYILTVCVCVYVPINSVYCTFHGHCWTFSSIELPQHCCGGACDQGQQL